MSGGPPGRQPRDTGPPPAPPAEAVRSFRPRTVQVASAKPPVGRPEPGWPAGAVHGALAQSGRALVWHTRGRAFKSRRLHSIGHGISTDGDAYAVPFRHGALAQSGGAARSHREGRGSESRRLHATRRSSVRQSTRFGSGGSPVRIRPSRLEGEEPPAWVAQRGLRPGRLPGFWCPHFGNAPGGSPRPLGSWSTLPWPAGRRGRRHGQPWWLRPRSSLPG